LCQEPFQKHPASLGVETGSDPAVLHQINFVFNQAGERLEVLARNALDELVMAAPAILRNQVYLRIRMPGQ
jgi:hypothetical protein